MSVSLKSCLEEDQAEHGGSVCPLCLKNPVKYTCPRCNTPYCSVDCYRSEKHGDCSESFYKECFMEGLKDSVAEPGEREKMIEMLKRAEADPELNVLDKPDDDLEERLDNLDLDKDTDKIWERLSEQEKHEFEAMVGDGRLATLVEIWTPWWMREAPLVQEVENQSEKDNDVNQSAESRLVVKSQNKSESPNMEGVKFENQSTKRTFKTETQLEISGKPKLKRDIPKISDLIKTKPSAEIKYNVINILYSYVFVCRLHNGEQVSMAAESAQDLVAISEVMGQGHNCGSTREAIQACLAKIQSSGGNFQPQPAFDISLIKDVERLICDSEDQFPMHSVLLALSDVCEIFKVAYKSCSRSLKQAKVDAEVQRLKKEKSDLFRCLKKCEFMISWAQTYGMALARLVPELEIEFSILSKEIETVDQSKKQLEAEWGGKTRPKKKTLVEELN